MTWPSGERAQPSAQRTNKLSAGQVAERGESLIYYYYQAITYFLLAPSWRLQPKALSGSSSVSLGSGLA